MSHFKTLYEHSLSRFTYGGVQINDYVKIKASNIEGANDTLKAELKELKESDLNLKVLELVNDTPTNAPTSPSNVWAVVGQEIAGGLFPRKVTIPVESLEVLSYNVPPSIPDSWKTKTKQDFDGEPTPVSKKKKAEDK